MTKITSADIYPSVICADYLNLGKDLKTLEKLGFEYLHVDIMDGSFVPQITIGEDFIKWCKKGCDLKIDTHLMIINPENHIDKFLKISDILSFHIESTEKSLFIAEKIKNAGILSSVAIKPNSDITLLKELLKNKLLDRILIMSVEPGMYGQKFIEKSFQRITDIHNMIKDCNSDIKIQIDGGININNIQQCRNLGVDFFVCGSAIFQNGEISNLHL